MGKYCKYMNIVLPSKKVLKKMRCKIVCRMKLGLLLSSPLTHVKPSMSQALKDSLSSNHQHTWQKLSYS